jgi:hypothetical protein
LDTVHELGEDVTHLKSDSVLLKSQINKLHEKFGQPQGSLSSRVGIQAHMKIADSTKVAPPQNPTRSYAAVAISGSSLKDSTYKKILEQNINAHQYWVIMLGDFNIPMIDLMAHHFPTLSTTLKLKGIQLSWPPAFLVLTNAITLL